MRVSLAVSFDSFYWIEIGSCMTLYQKRESETWYRKSNRPPQLSLQLILYCVILNLFASCFSFSCFGSFLVVYMHDSFG